MVQEKVDTYIIANQKYFPADKIVFLKQKLLEIDDTKAALISGMEFKDPTTLLLVSLFLGGLGIDRFMIGDVGMGILKLLTLGGLGIITIIDWFTIQRNTRAKNFNALMLVI